MVRKAKNLTSFWDGSEGTVGLITNLLGGNRVEVSYPDESTVNIRVPSKFKDNIKLGKGQYVVVINATEEMLCVLDHDNIKWLKDAGKWEFKYEKEVAPVEDSDSEAELVNHNQRKNRARAYSSSGSESSD